MTSAEASCRAHGTEATHWTISALDSSMILLDAVVEILAVPVSDIRAKLASDRARITVMPVRGHPGRSNASDRFGRSKELLCRGHRRKRCSGALLQWPSCECLICLRHRASSYPYV